MRLRKVITSFSLVLLLGLGACAEPVLEGPNHGAKGPPFIAEAMIQVVPEIVVEQRIILIGDAGLFRENDKTLAALGDWAGEVDASAVLFLGDNIYDNGLVEEARAEAEQILSQQLAATEKLKVFLPGNHDWGMDPAQQNLEAILNQQSFIDSWPQGDARFLPRDGCLGPATVEFPGQSRAVVLVLVDPTPFLTPRLLDVCKESADEQAHFDALAATLEQHADDYVIMASHYPLLTGGPHGGLSYGGIGDIIVDIYGRMYGGLGNTYEPRYADWIERVEAVMREHPPLIYAAGHDHNLQVLDGGEVATVQVVSGAGAKKRVSTVTDLPQTWFAHAAAGFVVLDFGTLEGEPAAVLRVIEHKHPAPVFEMLL